MITYKEVASELLKTHNTESCGLFEHTIMPISWDEPTEVDDDCIDELLELWFGSNYHVIDGEFVCIGEDDTTFFYSFGEDMFPSDNDKITLRNMNGFDEYIYIYTINE